MGVVLYGVAVNDLSRALGGACLTMTTLTLIALVAIRRWTTNTDNERRRLADATREADNERMRYMAGLAALELERQRVQRDADADREHTAARLKVERAAMRDQFEADRAVLICESLDTAFHLVRSGAFEGPITTRRGTVIGFPAPITQRAQETSRDRGATRG
ncbi:hypothetical protein [Streptomyces niveus]|uniref:hypothetical protein n=1 Tax=Streptomyces niveus TaxID=193462 RepID=UPI00114D1EE0|nr:hypothetical protein [Streptomyces niveus]